MKNAASSTDVTTSPRRRDAGDTRIAHALAAPVLSVVGVADIGELMSGGPMPDQDVRIAGFGYLEVCADTLPIVAGTLSDADAFYAILIAGGHACVLISTRRPFSSEALLFQLSCCLVAREVALHGVRATDAMIFTLTAADASWAAFRLEAGLGLCLKDSGDKLSCARTRANAFLRKGAGMKPVMINLFSSVMAMENRDLVPDFVIAGMPRDPNAASFLYGRSYEVNGAQNKQRTSKPKARSSAPATDLLDDEDIESIEGLEGPDASDAGSGQAAMES